MKRLIFFLLVVFCASPLHAQQVYTLGVVPQFEPRKLAGIWLPILKELESRTGVRLHLVGSRDIPEFEAGLRQGAFDFAYLNPYHAVMAERDQGYVPLVCDGGRSLYGVLAVREDSPITDVKQLNGAEISFPSPNALGASLLMRADLDQIVGINIEPKYVKTHSSVYLHVLLGKTAAGGGVMGTFNQQPQDVRDQLRILYKTRAIPPHPIAVHPRVSDTLRNRVKSELLKMAAEPRGAALLAKVPFKKLKAAKADDYHPLSQWGLEAYLAPVK